MFSITNKLLSSFKVLSMRLYIMQEVEVVMEVVDTEEEEEEEEEGERMVS